MIYFSSTGLWADIEALAINNTIKQAAVAYVTDESRVKFGKGDTLVLDASDKAISSGQTKADVINRAFRRGADIYSFPNLHAKVMLFGETAVIGSSNISSFSTNTLKEASIITDQKEVVNSVEKFIDQLKANACTQKIDKKFIERISSIHVITQGFVGNSIQKKKGSGLTNGRFTVKVSGVTHLSSLTPTC